MIQVQRGPVGLACWIHQLHLCREARLPKWMSCYDTQQTNGEAPVMLELWGMRSTPLLLSLSGPLSAEVVVPDTVLSMGDPVGWGCRIHRLHLCRRVRLPHRMSRIWQETIWWWGSRNAGGLGNAEFSNIAVAPRCTPAWSCKHLIGYYLWVK